MMDEIGLVDHAPRTFTNLGVRPILEMGAHQFLAKLGTEQLAGSHLVLPLIACPIQIIGVRETARELVKELLGRRGEG